MPVTTTLRREKQGSATLKIPDPCATVVARRYAGTHSLLSEKYAVAPKHAESLCTRCPGREKGARQHRRENASKRGHARSAVERKEKLKEKTSSLEYSQRRFPGRQNPTQGAEGFKNNGKREKDLWKHFFYLEINISGNIELAIDHENHAPLIGVEKR